MERSSLVPLLGNLKDVLLARTMEVGQLAALIQSIERVKFDGSDNIQSVEVAVYINQYNAYRGKYAHETCEKEQMMLDEIMRHIGYLSR